MAAVAALGQGRAAVAALRRSLPRGGPGIVRCKGVLALRTVLERRLVEAIVVSPRTLDAADWPALRAEFPRLPVVAYSSFRSEDGAPLAACRRAGVAAIAVEGVDDAVVGELVRRVSLAAERRVALTAAPRLLRLSEPIQLEVWHRLVERAGQPVGTSEVAAELGVTREHLSRQFGAGGAPNLKRVIDFLRVVVATQLLPNRGYGPARIAGLLGFASASHLRTAARRIAGVGTADLGDLTPSDLLVRFARGHTRSRL